MGPALVALVVLAATAVALGAVVLEIFDSVTSLIGG